MYQPREWIERMFWRIHLHGNNPFVKGIPVQFNSNEPIRILIAKEVFLFAMLEKWDPSEQIINIYFDRLLLFPKYHFKDEKYKVIEKKDKIY